MARKKRGMTDSELSAMVRGEIDDAAGYDESELALRRRKAMDYYDGRMPDVPSPWEPLLAMWELGAMIDDLVDDESKEGPKCRLIEYDR